MMLARNWWLVDLIKFLITCENNGILKNHTFTIVEARRYILCIFFLFNLVTSH